jgi:hypothetical protein
VLSDFSWRVLITNGKRVMTTVILDDLHNIAGNRSMLVVVADYRRMSQDTAESVYILTS